VKNGFTIVELLVSISIIAIISSMGIVQFSSAKQKARDAIRISEVIEIKKAISLYQIDNTLFPIETEEIIITGEDSFSLAIENAGAMVEVPTDPQHPNFSYTYQSNSAGNDYDLKFCLETDTMSNYSIGCVNTISP